MYYAAITVSTIPGKRFEGIGHLKKYAEWAEGKFGIPTQVLGNMTGTVYENHVVFQFESMAQMEEMYEKMLADPEYQLWFNEATGVLGWDKASQQIYQVF